MEAKAAQSVNDQEPWRSLQRGRHAIKVTDGGTTAAAAWRRSKSPSINSDWNGHRTPRKVSLSVKLWQLAETGGVGVGVQRSDHPPPDFHIFRLTEPEL